MSFPRYYCEACRRRRPDPTAVAVVDGHRTAPPERATSTLACPECHATLVDLTKEEAWEYLREIDRVAEVRRDHHAIWIAVPITLAALALMTFPSWFLAWLIPAAAEMPGVVGTLPLAIAGAVGLGIGLALRRLLPCRTVTPRLSTFEVDELRRFCQQLA